jgi:hypothetical protein
MDPILILFNPVPTFIFLSHTSDIHSSTPRPHCMCKPITFVPHINSVIMSPSLVHIPAVQNYCGLGLCPSSGTLENTTFRKLDLFLSSGESGWEGKTPTQLGPLRRANLNHWTRSSGEGETPNLLGPLETANLNHWATFSSVGGRHLLSWVPYKELTSISGLCFLFFRILDDGQSLRTQ